MIELKVGISENAHKTLLQLAENSGDTIQSILDLAVENYRKYIFLMQANEAFTALRNNEVLWQEELAERQLWAETIADGIEE